jgi:hypothetical protein
MALFIFKSSAITSHIDWYIFIGVSEEPDTSVFKVGDKAISCDIYLFKLGKPIDMSSSGILRSA